MNEQDHERGLQRAERDPHEEEHEHRRDEQLEDQVIDLLFSRLAIVSRDTDLFTSFGISSSSQLIDTFDNLFCDGYPVGTFLLGNGDGDGWNADRAIGFLRRRTGVVGDRLRGILRALANVGHVVDVDRRPVVTADLQALDVFYGLEECTRIPPSCANRRTRRRPSAALRCLR
jgi:hypothetical protein